MGQPEWRQGRRGGSIVDLQRGNELQKAWQDTRLVSFELARARCRVDVASAEHVALLEDVPERIVDGDGNHRNAEASVPC